MINDYNQDIDKYFLTFGSKDNIHDATESNIVYMRILDENENIVETIKIPWETYDDILVNISENFYSGFSVVTIDVPITSTIFRYLIVMMNNEEYMIIRKYNMHSKELLSEYFVIYNNIY